MKSLIAEGVDTIFGYPGGAIIPVYDVLYDYQKELRHILVRHEQGATHAAEGYSRVSGRPGVVMVTSGPAATNVITGLSDAQMDSTPMVVITGQVASASLGSDAFQETDVIGITQPLTKWSYQIRSAQDIQWAVSRAFYIATTGRPGPVVLDFAKNAQLEKVEWKEYKQCNYIRSYIPYPEVEDSDIDAAAALINAAERPLIFAGHGIELAQAEPELKALAEKAEIPVACTLLGKSTIPTAHPLNVGMLGMHGNVGVNVHTTDCDLMIAIGMRFDDRVTGKASTYGAQATKIHIDIDESEFNKNVKCDVVVVGDAKAVLKALLPKIEETKRTEWLSGFDICDEIENKEVIEPEVHPTTEMMHMGEVVAMVSEVAGDEAVLVTDVGQNQMFASRYFKFSKPDSIVTSGGLGTMGFGLPASIGAKVAEPERTVCFFTGDGGMQMTIEELGVIMEYGIGVKIIILNNNFLGMVRQWQELFFHERYSQTPMTNPNFVMIANAYGIPAEDVESREQLKPAIERMINTPGAYILNVNIEPDGLVFPMIPAGGEVKDMMLKVGKKYFE